MKLLTLFTLLFISFSLYAFTLETQVHSFDEGRNGKPHLIRLRDGEVAFIPYGEKSLLKLVKESQINKDHIRIGLDRDHNLISLEKKTEKDLSLEDQDTTPDGDFKPSILTLTQATKIFNRMSKKYQKDSQCFNRAHIWVYDEFVRSGTNLNKVFLFFTSRYIRRYRFHWWFHVTPMGYVGGTNQRNWRMLDRRYTSGPLLSKTWTNIFIKSKKTCPAVDTFSQYFENQYAEDCYLIRADPYYLVPSDLDMLEAEGVKKTSYDPIEVEHARWEAF